LGPIVNRCSWHSMVPSISPSRVKSSRANIWPLMVTFFPNAAEPLRTGLDSDSNDRVGADMVLNSLLGGSAAGVGAGGVVPGLCGISSSRLLLHMRRGSPRKCCLHRTTVLLPFEVRERPACIEIKGKTRL
jgi:hypothetical protein